MIIPCSISSCANPMKRTGSKRVIEVDSPTNSRTSSRASSSSYAARTNPQATSSRPKGTYAETEKSRSCAGVFVMGVLYPVGGGSATPLGPVRTVKSKYFFRDSKPASDSRDIFQPLPPALSSRYTIPFRSISGSSQSFPSPSLHREQSNPLTSPVS